jgi:hypothetical protein
VVQFVMQIHTLQGSQGTAGGSVKAALSGSQTKAPGFAGGYLLMKLHSLDFSQAIDYLATNYTTMRVQS